MKDLPELDLSAALHPADQASCLPPECYVSDTVCDAEVERIFRRHWLCVGRADMVANPGDVQALDMAGQSLILLRDQDAKLQCFANTCRHRAARLVDGSSNCKGLRCPFHSWFYALDGRLVSAPKMEAASGFDRADHGLIAYAVEERHGFAFVCLARQPEPLDDHLADFGTIHAPWPLESLVSARRLELEVACNWKAFLEVFNEYYHLPFVHPDTVDAVYALPDPADDVRGAFATQYGATDGTGGLLEDTQHAALPPIPGLAGPAAHGARYTWMFPNMSFAANQDALWCYEAYPMGPNRCKVVQTSCFPPESMALPEFAAKSAIYLERMDAALAEDVPALENQHRGFAHPDAVAGRFQPDLEPNVASFARWYAAVMQSQ